jgi:ribosomal protein S18 acetylase RimI-like enzyme
MIIARPIAEADYGAAAELLAARERRLRSSHPSLPVAFEEPAACEQLLRDTMRFSDGVVAEEQGRVAGVLCGFRQLTPPTAGRARFAPPRAAMMLAHSHAVATDLDAGHVYGALYAQLSAGWVATGILDHTAHVPAAEHAVSEAWADLGFGRGGAFALRNAAASLPAARDDIDVRIASIEDLEVVSRLVDEEARFHAGPPIYRPYVSDDVAEAVREEHRGMLESGEADVFIASVDGREAAVMSIGPANGSPQFVPERCAYVGDTATLPWARRRGAGTALLVALNGWAVERGFEHLALHVAMPNRVSVPFWRSLGFVEVMYHLHRRIDPRITWGRPPPEE